MTDEHLLERLGELGRAIDPVPRIVNYDAQIVFSRFGTHAKARLEHRPDITKPFQR